MNSTRYEPLLSEAVAGRKALYLRKPIRDHGVPDSAERMQEILDALDRALADGRCIYLHCRAGIGRTNVVAGCWIANRGGGGDAALERLNRLWRGSAALALLAERARDRASRPISCVAGGRAKRGGPPQSDRPDAAAAGDLRDRIRGLLLGLAAGDAQCHALHGLPAGAWSDKTAMALCLAESLVVPGRFRSGRPGRALSRLAAQRPLVQHRQLRRHQRRNEPRARGRAVVGKSLRGFA